MSALMTNEFTYEGRPVLLVITLSPRNELQYTIPAANDSIIRHYVTDLQEQLDALADRLRDREFPFSFLGED